MQVGTPPDAEGRPTSPNATLVLGDRIDFKSQRDIANYGSMYWYMSSNSTQYDVTFLVEKGDIRNYTNAAFAITSNINVTQSLTFAAGAGGFYNYGLLQTSGKKMITIDAPYQNQGTELNAPGANLQFNKRFIQVIEGRIGNGPGANIQLRDGNGKGDGHVY